MKSLRTLFATIGFILLAVAPVKAQEFSFDEMRWHRFVTDFDRYAAGDWTITRTGSGTTALTALDGGAILITNAAADNDNSFFQLPVGTFRWQSGKRLFFKTRFKVSDATQSDIAIGLQVIDTTPLDVTDGIFFLKDDDSPNLFFRVEKSNTVTAAATTAIGALANDTFVTLAFYYEPSDGRVQFFINDVLIGARPTTNIPDTTDLSVSFGLQNGSAAARTMTLDYVFAAQER
jgi:hypothetical protein